MAIRLLPLTRGRMRASTKRRPAKTIRILAAGKAVSIILRQELTRQLALPPPFYFSDKNATSGLPVPIVQCRLRLPEAYIIYRKPALKAPLCKRGFQGRYQINQF